MLILAPSSKLMYFAKLEQLLLRLLLLIVVNFGFRCSFSLKKLTFNFN